MSRHHRFLSTLVRCVLLVVCTIQIIAADQKLNGIACRSVHLGYQNVPDAAVFYNEVRIESSAEGTYF